MESALGSIVKHIEKFTKQENDFAITYTTAQGPLSLPSRQDVELFEVIAPLKAYAPDQLAELLKSHAELAHTLEAMPDGFNRSMVQGASMGRRSSSTAGSQTQSSFLANSTLTAQALKALKDSPDRALEIAKTIPDMAARAGCYSSMASALAAKDETLTRRSISLSMDSLAEAGENAADRSAQTWRQIITIANDRLKDKELAREALTRSFRTLEQSFHLDSNPDDPNVAPIDFWPSSRAWRDTAELAVKVNGSGAVSLFERIHDPNELLLVQVSVAGALVDRPSKAGIYTSMHPKRQKI